MSAIRRTERAAKKAVEIAEKEAKKGKPRLRPPVPAKEPSARPYREPEPVPKEKRVVRTVSQRDGQNLLRKIEGKGGRDIIIMMRDSQRSPQELAEYLMLNEGIVITCLNSYGSNKDRVERLLTAIAQSRVYLENDERPVTTGVKKQKRQSEAQAKQEKIASEKRHPRTRVFVVPTLAEVAPRPEDPQIVLEELKQYLELNADLRNQVLGASSDYKAARILMFNVGQRFDAKVKVLLAAPSEYQDLLAEAGATIRREARKYDTSDTSSTGPTPSIQETPEAIARRKSQEDALARYKRAVDTRGETAQPDAEDPDMEAKRELFSHQEAVLKGYVETRDEHS